MRIEIRPHIGSRRGIEIDTGLDGIWIVDAQTPNGRRVGFAQRRPGGPAQLTEDVSAAAMRAIGQALDDRDFAELPEEKQTIARGQRQVQRAPEIVTDETGDDEDDE